jgi:phospholipase/carboxylesterase
MLATDVSLRLEEAAGGLAVLSGTLLVEDVWRAKAKARTGLEIFQSHGRQDPVLPFEAAEWLSALFEEADMRHEFVPFTGGHTIPNEVLDGLGDFLARRLA